MLISCSVSSQNKQANQSKEMCITKLIRYSVTIKDTSKLYEHAQYGDSTLQIGKINENTFDVFIDRQSYNQFVSVLKKSFTNDKVFFVAANKKISKQEAMSRAFSCDSIDLSEYDELGNETFVRKLVCLNQQLNTDVDQIEFLEAWYFDTETFQIRKEILAYSLLVPHDKFPDLKNVKKNILSIYKNEEAFLRVRELNGD